MGEVIERPTLPRARRAGAFRLQIEDFRFQSLPARQLWSAARRGGLPLCSADLQVGIL
jgi:hypothetical protein